MTVTKLSLAPSQGIDQYTLINEHKTLAVMVLNYGATITHILTPDKQGHVRDVVLGFDNYEDYKSPNNPYFGATIGRYANRIGQGQFTVDGQTYQLAINNAPNALHGGSEGFDKKLWNVTVVSENPASIQLELISNDGDQSYPGTLTTQVTYTVTDRDELEIRYHATTDKDTVVNLTNHTYFNLSGLELSPKVLGHEVSMSEEVKGFLKLDKDSLPTGELATWADAPWMNFTGADAGQTIGARLDKLADTNGYDHPYVLHENYQIDTIEEPLRQAATVYCPETGIELGFSTTEPCFQFYTGNFIPTDELEGTKAQQKTPIGPHSGFCLESQRPPDAPNKPQWRSAALLQEKDIYGGKTVFAFRVRQ
ncbi:hypothetical protein DFQ28_001379 [Apophysomyces sp. BC1034]|nr:hypothetical protein DFQ30_001637 [Apophysomyces sp. BC1015]KAG0178352.1 hypothetical protein DFQ29_003585 [Apophysomyces sp. BC1021]KAG0190897.1 hypothetical protein DFQ28_001379 [Apophysomyces sp. BC1034]